MPFTKEEGVCAQQMKDILTATHIAYESLIDSPEVLLRVSSGHEGCNGALWTRFTVQVGLGGLVGGLGG